MVDKQLGNDPRLIPLGRCQICWTIFAVLALFGIGFIVSSTLIDKFSRALSPIDFHSVRFLQNSARAGGWVELEIDRTRRQSCPGLVFQYWRQGKSVIQQQVLPAGPDAAIGRQVSVFSKQLPKAGTLKAGEICYAPRMLYLCADSAKLIDQPPACLDVEL